MVIVNLDGCECVCTSAQIAKEVAESSGSKTVLLIVLGVIVIALVIIGLIFGFKEFTSFDDDDDDEERETYY